MEPISFSTLTCLLLIIKVKNSGSERNVMINEYRKDFHSILTLRRQDLLKEDECNTRLDECKYDEKVLIGYLKQLQPDVEACESSTSRYIPHMNRIKSRATKEVNQAQNGLQMCNTSILSLEQEEEETQEYLDSIRNTSQELENEKLEPKKKVDACEKNLNDEREKAKKCEDDKKLVDDELDKAKKEIEQEKKENERREKEKKDVENEIQEIEKRINATVERSEQLFKENMNSRSEINTLKRELDAIRPIMEERRKRLIAQKIEELKNKTEEAKEEVKVCEPKLKVKDEEINRLREEYKAKQEEAKKQEEVTRQEEASQVQKPKVQKYEPKTKNLLSPFSDALEVVKSIKVGVGKKMHGILDHLKIGGISKNRKRNK